MPFGVLLSYTQCAFLCTKIRAWSPLRHGDLGQSSWWSLWASHPSEIMSFSAGPCSGITAGNVGVSGSAVTRSNRA